MRTVIGHQQLGHFVGRQSGPVEHCQQRNIADRILSSHRRDFERMANLMWLDDRRFCHPVMPSILNALRGSMVLPACKHNQQMHPNQSHILGKKLIRTRAVRHSASRLLKSGAIPPRSQQDRSVQGRSDAMRVACVGLAQVLPIRENGNQRQYADETGACADE